MKKLLLMVFVSAAALLAAGCASMERYNSAYSEVQRDWQSSRFMRGEVGPNVWVKDTDIEGVKLQVIFIYRTPSGAGAFEAAWVVVPESLNLQNDDIVDVYVGTHTFFISDDDYLSQPENLRTQVLGIVCRGDDAGCERNSTPQLTIGWGRKMRGANEYQGVVAEAKQRIYPGEIDRGDTGLGVYNLTTSYAAKGIAADYEDPPTTQQQPHPALCAGLAGFFGCSDE